MKRALIFAMMASSIVMAQGQRVRMTGIRWPSRLVDVPRDGIMTAAEVRQGRVSLAAAGAPSYSGDVIAIYDPTSGAFWWTLKGSEAASEDETVTPFLAHNRILMREGRLVVFSFVSPSLGVRESRGRATSMEDAQSQAVAELGRNWDAIRSDKYDWGRSINLRDALGSDFLYKKGSASAEPSPKLRSVAFAEGKWNVVLDGPNGDTATLILGEDYRVLEAKVTAQ